MLRGHDIIQIMGEQMRLVRFQTVRDFLACAEDFLATREAEHNLQLGICSVLLAQPNFYPNPPYFAVVQENNKILLAALMTPPHQLVLSLGDSSREVLEMLAQDVRQFRPETPGVLGPSAMSLRFSEAWQVLTEQPFRKSRAERIYKLERVKPPARVPGRMRRATEADRPLLLEWIREFQSEAFGEIDKAAVERAVNSALTMPPEVRGMYLWEDGQPISLTGYSGPTPNGIRIGPVYTPPRFRRRGYASALVAGVSQHLLNTGRKFCFLFTDLANPTSNKIYIQIGYQPVCDVDEYRFGTL
jgi:predicted GNAT family acetyltransferase